MFRLDDGQFFREFRTLLFHHIIFLTLIQSSIGEVQIIGPLQPLVARVGDDIILPCHLKPAVDASNMPVAWLRPDLNPGVVHLWKEGAELVFTKNMDYDGRTSLSLKKMKQGDISLTLHKVVLTDNGTYKCYLQVLNITSSVELVVGADSSPVATIAQMNTSSSKVILQCESKGWYPEPEVIWLDGERNLLSAGPTETVRGPDGLYTVSSRVTVEKRHNNNFTCRVQANKQTRETHIIVPDLLSEQPNSSSSVPTIIGVTVGVFGTFGIFIILAVLVWKRQNKLKAANRGRENNHPTSNNPSVQYHVVPQGSQTENENVSCRIQLQEGNRNYETEVDGQNGGVDIQLPNQEEQESTNNKTEVDEQHENIPPSLQNVSGETQQLALVEEQDIRINEMRHLLEETLRKELEEEKNKRKAIEDENKMLKENLENMQLQLEDEKEKSDQLKKNLKNITLQLVERDNKHKDSELENEERDTSEENDAEHNESEDEDSEHEDSEHEDSEHEDSKHEDSDFDHSVL